MEFCESYRPYFRVARHNVMGKARCYVAGLLMKAPRKNMERMEEYVEEYEYQAQQQFLSDSPWDHPGLIARIGHDVDAVVGGEESALVIDETAFEKKGTKSVGVARQWNGRLGKVDNCQVGVFAALSDGRHGSLVDVRLYLPESWSEDPPRCAAAKIPLEERTHRSKAELALEMIDAAVAHRLRFGWVCFDGGYGHLPWLLRAVADRGLRFIGDVHADQHIYLSDPCPYVPRRKQPRGRKFTRLRARSDAVEIRTVFEQMPAGRWRRIRIRASTKGELEVQAARQRVWLWDGHEKQARAWWAVCTRHPGTGETKWFLSNASEKISLTTLVRRHAMRFRIERIFQDAKTSVGMADYQARGWPAWYHHMSLVMLALLFLLRERKFHRKDFELLSCQDIVELLNFYLPRADRTEEAVLRNMQRRHQKRMDSIEAARRKRKVA